MPADGDCSIVSIDESGGRYMNNAAANGPIANESSRIRQTLDYAVEFKTLGCSLLDFDARGVYRAIRTQSPFDFYKRAYLNFAIFLIDCSSRDDMDCAASNRPVSNKAGRIGQVHHTPYELNLICGFARLRSEEHTSELQSPDH